MGDEMPPLANDVHLPGLDQPLPVQVKLDQLAVADALRRKTGCPVKHLPQTGEPGAMAKSQDRTICRKNTLLDAQDPPREVGKWFD